jgi:broad specificity phosphatase PhoE
MSKLYLVRHGQASFGSRDYDQLSPLGVTQSELLGKWLAASGQWPGLAVHGTMKRQRQTAQTCLASWIDNPQSVVANEDGSFDEFDHKEILLRSHPEFAEPGWLERFLAEQPNGRKAFQKVFGESVARWVAGKNDGDYTETWPGFRTRCIAGLHRVAETTPENDIWIFTSGGPIAAIAQHVLGIPDDKILDVNWSILNSSVSQFTHRSGKTRLKLFNSVAHLTLPNRTDLFSYR